MSNEPKYQRFISQLRGDELETIAAIKKPEDITEFTIIDEWRDDHEACVGFRLNGVETSAWWIIREFVRELYRLDDDAESKSKKVVAAKKELINYIEYELEAAKEEMEYEAKKKAAKDFVTSTPAKDIASIEVSTTSNNLDGRNADVRIWKNPLLARREYMYGEGHWWMTGGTHTCCNLKITTNDDRTIGYTFDFMIGDLTNRHAARQSSVRIWEALRTLRKNPTDRKAITLIRKEFAKQLSS